VATKIINLWIDDLTGEPADETVPFELDGHMYEIDLNRRNATQLRAALKPYVDRAVQLTPSRRKKAPTVATKSLVPAKTPTVPATGTTGSPTPTESKAPVPLVVGFSSQKRPEPPSRERWRRLGDQIRLEFSPP
jgi:hypothetical protein